MDRLEVDLERWQAVKDFLEKTVIGPVQRPDSGGDTNNNSEFRKQLLSVRYFDDNLSLRILDNLAKELAAVGRQMDVPKQDSVAIAKPVARKASDITYKVRHLPTTIQ